MTVDMYIWQQKDEVRELLDYMHHLILHLAPNVSAAVKWNVPYYTLNQGLLYMNPLKTKEAAVEICFTRGQLFEFGKELLQVTDRKLVGGYTITALETIDEGILRQLLEEAIRLDSLYSNRSPWQKHT